MHLGVCSGRCRRRGHAVRMQGCCDGAQHLAHRLRDVVSQVVHRILEGVAQVLHGLHHLGCACGLRTSNRLNGRVQSCLFSLQINHTAHSAVTDGFTKHDSHLQGWIGASNNNMVCAAMSKHTKIHHVSLCSLNRTIQQSVKNHNCHDHVHPTIAAKAQPMCLRDICQMHDGGPGLQHATTTTTAS